MPMPMPTTTPLPFLPTTPTTTVAAVVVDTNDSSNNSNSNSNNKKRVSLNHPQFSPWRQQQSKKQQSAETQQQQQQQQQLLVVQSPPLLQSPPQTPQKQLSQPKQQLQQQQQQTPGRKRNGNTSNSNSIGVVAAAAVAVAAACGSKSSSSRRWVVAVLLLSVGFAVTVQFYSLFSMAWEYHNKNVNDSQDMHAFLPEVGSTTSTTAAAAAASNVRPNLQLQGKPPQAPHDYQNSHKFAYAFVLGGVDIDSPKTYRGYLYNIIVAASTLREQNSTADIVLLIQIVPNNNDKNNKQQQQERQEQPVLPPYDVRILQQSKVDIYYIPPPQPDEPVHFYKTMMDKFRILTLVHYSRILFMDGDVLPIHKLDYLFHKSVQGILQRNVVVQGTMEPANGGFFMLAPSSSQSLSSTDIQSTIGKASPHLDRINEVLHNRVVSGRKYGPPRYFDPVLGWGTSPLPDDWHLAKASEYGRNWTFYAAFADQGLLYYWTKYVERSVSIIARRGQVENWGESHDENGVAVVQQLNLLDRPFYNDTLDYTTRSSQSRAPCIPQRMTCLANPPISDFVHFTGYSKPWMSPFANLTQVLQSWRRQQPQGGEPHEQEQQQDKDKDGSSWVPMWKGMTTKEYWYYKLAQANERYNLDIDFSNFAKTFKRRKPSLGLYPTYSQALSVTTISGDLIPHATAAAAAGSTAATDETNIQKDKDKDENTFKAKSRDDTSELENDQNERETIIETEEEQDENVDAGVKTDEPDNNEEELVDETTELDSVLPPSSSLALNDTARYHFAYAFVIGGCDPHNPVYRTYLYNIMVSALVLQEQNSTADVVTFIQMSWKSNATVLPYRDERMLSAMGIHIYYIPPVEDSTFYRTMLDKFRILGLTQYDRVLFMDGDVMPINKMDYLFELSVRGIIQENLVVQGMGEPANGGFFMLKPEPGAIQEMDRVIRRRAQMAKDIGPPNYFDNVVGWGHAIQPGDEWWTAKSYHGSLWTFWAAFADQGLLYYWTKYNRKSVSIILRRDRVQNWGPVEVNGTTQVRVVKTLVHPFRPYTVNTNLKGACFPHRMQCLASPPHSDSVHFTGRGKPWLSGPPKNFHNMTVKEIGASTKNFWFWKLSILNDRLDLGLNFSRWKEDGLSDKPLLGMYPTKAQAARVDSLGVLDIRPASVHQQYSSNDL